MAGITLEQAEAQLALYLDAEQKVLLGQSYEIAGRRLARADLQWIQEGIKVWNDRASALGAVDAGGSRRRTIIPAG